MEFQTIALPAFERWLAGLRDVTARVAVARRVDRLRRGNFGDVKPVGGGVSEARIHSGPGFRLYFVQSGASIVLLLCGGTKRTQASDIETAKLLWRNYRR